MRLSSPSIMGRLVVFASIVMTLAFASNRSLAADLGLVKSGTFTIAHDDSYPPFGFADKKEGRYLASQGFEIELLEKICKRMGLKAEFQPNAWAKVLVSVKLGTADAIATIGNTEERQKSYDYSEPYSEYASKLFVLQGSKISRLVDLEGKKVSIAKNLFSIPWIRKHYPKVDLVQLENTKEAFLALQSGKVEGAISDRLVGLYSISQDRLGGKIQATGEVFAATPVALAFAKGTKMALREKFNSALRDIKKTEDFSLIFSKWFSEKP